MSTLRVYRELEQGTPEWLDARCGIITASVIGQLITAKTLKPSTGETARAVIETLAAERITGHVDPIHVTPDMERGTLDEPYARDLYAEHYAPVEEIGFMVRETDTYRLGYSPDGLVGNDGLTEIKSRRPKKHLRTILADAVPAENMAQIQTGLLVSGRAWCDYISYAGGWPLYVKRVYPDPAWRAAIEATAAAFEVSMNQIIATYSRAVEGLPVAERIDHYAEMEF